MSTLENQPAASVVIVSFGSEADVGDAVAGLPSAVEIIVVEQRATGTAIEVAQQVRPDVIGIRSGANRGFGAGCNLGAANATAPVLVFMNPDTRAGDEILELAAACTEADGAIVGPTIQDGAGVDVTQARRWSSPMRDAAELLVPRLLTPSAWQKDIPPSDPVYRTGGPVPYVQGSCFAVGRDRFVASGGFDERFFLYGEEEYLARRFEHLGLSTRLCPEVVVAHEGQTSTSAVALFAAEQMYRSRVITYRQAGGPMRAAWGGLALLVALSLLWLSTPLRKLVRFRPLETAAWCRAAIRGVRAGMFVRWVEGPS